MTEFFTSSFILLYKTSAPMKKPLNSMKSPIPVFRDGALELRVPKQGGNFDSYGS
jgi:hypothetical protein